MVPEVSVVIPTHNRLEVLAEVLQALEFQHEAPSFEVVVVDDGSTDGTSDWLRARSFNLPLRVLTQENRGPAAARNTGVAVAGGRWVFFLGDDTVPAPDWLAVHRQAHRLRGDDTHLAVIGYTGWHRRMRLNPFLRYINEHGLQFGYALIRDREDVPFNFLYTSNLSLPRDLLIKEPFDLRFPYPAWEDIEVGYRLKKRGMRLTYEPQARVAHDHPTDFARFAVRQEKAGYCAVVFYRLHPELGGFLGLGPQGPPPLPPEVPQRRREGLVRALQRWPLSMPKTWDETLRYHYIQGLHRAWAELGAEVQKEMHHVEPQAHTRAPSGSGDPVDGRGVAPRGELAARGAEPLARPLGQQQ
jgi:GT2 family glycosyltransferase